MVGCEADHYFYKLARAKSERIDNFSGKILNFLKKTIYLYRYN